MVKKNDDALHALNENEEVLPKRPLILIKKKMIY